MTNAPAPNPAPVPYKEYEETENTFLFRIVAVVGVGMMGGSVGLALRAEQAAGQIIGIDTDAAILARAQEIGAIDTGTTDVREGVANADLVILAAPVQAIPFLLETLVPLARPDALITDIGSAKRHIVEAGERWFGPRFVGGHPMAGSPQGGVDAALPGLFHNVPWVIVRTQTPELETDACARRLHALILRLKARPVLLDALLHDEIAARVSHLPHLLSFAFADLIAAFPDAEQARGMAGSSYRDFVRVAGSNRAFWQAIFRDNREPLLAALDEYEARLKHLRQAIETEDRSEPG